MLHQLTFGDISDVQARSIKFKDSSGKDNHWTELRLVNKHGSDFTLALFFDGPNTLPAELAHAINQVMVKYRREPAAPTNEEAVQ
jgi:hypothetical protein